MSGLLTIIPEVYLNPLKYTNSEILCHLLPLGVPLIKPKNQAMLEENHRNLDAAVADFNATVGDVVEAERGLDVVEQA